jgi:cob(I)alamin adenosyltransferase
MAFRIYTKTGDAGETALFGGRRVSKADLRVEAYGTLDELNAFIGVLCDGLPPGQVPPVLSDVQRRLFSLGSYLATDPDKPLMALDLLESDVDLLEQEMDRMDDALPELRHFILPGGHPSVSAAHVCRTVCRRAERLTVALHSTQPLEPLALRYLNRLSDYFFVLARFIGQANSAPEVVWTRRDTSA